MVCVTGLSACGSISTQDIQTNYIHFAIPLYRQKTSDNIRQDHRTSQTGSLFVEYDTIAAASSFTGFMQATIDTLRQNLGSKLQDNIIQSQIAISCSGNTLSGDMLSFSIHQDEDVLYLSQIFTIHNTNLTVISLASFANNIRSQTTKSITDTIACKL